jgi:prephenate dehydratase
LVFEKEATIPVLPTTSPGADAAARMEIVRKRVVDATCSILHLADASFSRIETAGEESAIASHKTAFTQCANSIRSLEKSIKANGMGLCELF